MSIRVAITRAEPEAHATAARVRARGAEPVVAPLLTIKTLTFDASLTGVQAVLFTSGAGVRAFAHASPNRDATVLTVGDASASLARAAGFARVTSASGDVAALAALASATLEQADGVLLHISGRDVAGDLIGALANAGFRAERRIAYEAAPAVELPEGLRGPLDVVLFHSARAATVFAHLGAPASLELVAGCLSPSVARAATVAPWRRVIVAPAPREEALLDACIGSPGSPAGASA